MQMICVKKMWVAPGEKAAPRQKMRWAPKCHVWGAIGVGWRYLAILPNDSSIMSETYIKTLRKTPFPRNFIFQQDGAGAHTAKMTKSYLFESEIQHIKNWPANSPDLNPIENVWEMIQQRVCGMNPSSTTSLIRCVKKAFKVIPRRQINKTVLSFDRRLEACVKCKGEKVKKW